MMAIHWFNNPVTNALFMPLAILSVVMFGIAALALVVFHLFHAGLHKNASSFEKVLWRRYLTWAMIAPLFAGALLSGPLAIAILCAFLCWQGGREYALLTAIPAGYRSTLIAGGWITIAAVWLLGPSTLVLGPMLGFFVWSIMALQPVKGETEVGERFMSGIVGLWGYLYLGWLPAFLVALSAGKVPGLVFVVGLGVALSDVGAFCVGKTLGGPRLAPLLSPNKTWSGVGGNVLGAALALLMASFALPVLPLWQRALLVLTIGLGSVWGDLLESLLKRQRGVKDAGALLPGFGGLLDRIDSLLLVTPLVYYLALLLRQ
jgi:phosphatidate cytidylyltransferase